MSIRKTESFTARCDACGHQMGGSYPTKDDLTDYLLANHTHVDPEDDSCFCAACMKIYRSVALSLIPEAFETKEVPPCEPKP